MKIYQATRIETGTVIFETSNLPQLALEFSINDLDLGNYSVGVIEKSDRDVAEEK